MYIWAKYYNNLLLAANVRICFLILSGSPGQTRTISAKSGERVLFCPVPYSVPLDTSVFSAILSNWFDCKGFTGVSVESTPAHFFRLCRKVRAGEFGAGEQVKKTSTCSVGLTCGLHLTVQKKLSYLKSSKSAFQYGIKGCKKSPPGIPAGELWVFDYESSFRLSALFSSAASHPVRAAEELSVRARQ